MRKGEITLFCNMSTITQNPYVQQARQIVEKHLAGHAAHAYLFGSRAKGTESRHSDIDIGILPLATMKSTVLPELREAFEESTIPYTVDIVDLSLTDQHFRQKVLSEGILWKD